MSRVMCLAFVCALAAHAHGSPRSDPTMGRAVFTGAATGNATSIDLNPAAIGLGPTRAEQLREIPNEVYLAALGVLDSLSIERRELDIDTGTLSPGASISDTTMSAGGTIAGIWHTGSDGQITLAGQIRTAPGERFIEHDALRYHTSGGYHRTISPLTIAASLRITNRIYIGVSLAAQSSFLKLRWSRDTALDAGRDPDRGIGSDCGGAPCGVENRLAEERYEIDVSSGLFSTSILAANLGFVIGVARDVWLGFAYHTPPGLAIQNELSGQVEIVRSPRDGGETARGGATVYIAQPASVDVGLRARLPRLLDLHVGARWEHLSRFQGYDVRSYGSTIEPSLFPEWQPRPRGFQSTYALWAGVEQVEHDAPFIAGARLGIETSAVEDRKTSPTTIAPTSLTADAGVQYRLIPQVVLQATYGLQYFPTVDATDSAFDPGARIQCIDSGYDYDTVGCAKVRNGYAIPTAAGDYQRVEHAVRLAVRIELP